MFARYFRPWHPQKQGDRFNGQRNFRNVKLRMTHRDKTGTEAFVRSIDVTRAYSRVQKKHVVQFL